MKKRLPYSFRIVLLLSLFFLVGVTGFARSDSTHTEIRIKAGLGTTGLGVAIEVEPVKRLSLEIGGTSFIILNRVYTQVKYAVYRNERLSIGIGADLSYIKTDVFNYETVKISPLIDLNINKWGFQLAAREPEYIDLGVLDGDAKVKNYYILLGITYKIVEF